MNIVQIPAALIPKDGIGKNTPRYIVQHFTASGSGQALARWVAGKTVVKGKAVPPAKYFAHFIICRDGTIIQQAATENVVYHAAGRFPDGRALAGESVNHNSIGIENANYGWLIREGGSFFLPKKVNGEWVKGKPYPQRGLPPYRGYDHMGNERWWEPFPAAQVDANATLCEYIRTLHPEVTEMIRHSDISPDRKTDPGPLFPFKSIYDQAFVDDEDEVEWEDIVGRRHYDEDDEMCLA